ncbi:hypothetical protein [Sodalis sp.]|uniref:hypothetical protein n=1 Tax=Sodalis sp. (in: enterobacteria) TaxID=1898979 RepID=UPI00387399A2
MGAAIGDVFALSEISLLFILMGAPSPLATSAALIISLLFAIPFIWLASSAFRPVSQTFQASVDLWTLIPER